MGSVDDILQLCRLCLVKDQVNIPIFDETSDIRQTFLKINSCLPVKVSRDDSLPKKICDGCSYKLDMLYVFRNTSVDSEKQLLSWLDQIGLSTNSMLQDQDAESEKPEVTVKQEALESSDRIEEGEDDNGDMGDDSHSYLMQQQKLPYQDFEFGEPSSSNTDLMGSDEPAPKRAKRAAAMKKHVSEETEEDELDAAMQITKAEDEDSDEIDNPDFGEEEIPSTSADDQDQPGPSGVGKGSIEAPSSLQLGKQVCCPYCSKIYKSRRGLGRHLVIHGEKKYICSLCPKSYYHKVNLTIHVDSIHKKIKTLNCTYCDYSTAVKNNLKEHIIGRHTKIYPLKCDICDAGFTSKAHLNAHRKVEHEGLRLVCEICTKIFKYANHLRAHLQTHDPIRESYRCQECPKIFNSKSGLKFHIKGHNGEGNIAKTHVCEICGKSVIHLDIHMKRHAGDRQFICDICGKKFFTTNSLKVHSVTHTKEKPHKCNLCQKSYTQRTSLVIHMRSHTGTKPYNCGVCTKSFVTNTLLKYHKCNPIKNIKFL